MRFGVIAVCMTLDYASSPVCFGKKKLYTLYHLNATLDSVLTLVTGGRKRYYETAVP